MSITSTALTRANIQFHAATAALRPHVGCFWIITAESGATIRIVADGTTTLAIEQRGNREVEGYLRGPLLQPVELRFEAPTTLIGVRLRPGVAFNLTGAPTHSLVDRRVRFTDCGTLRELASIARAPQAPADWIVSLQTFLISRLAATSVHPLVEKALAEIHSARGDIAIAEVAERCGVSDRHLTRLMRDWIGYGTKRYAGIVRFQATLAQMERAPALPVAALASETGYFDQSHLTVDVARYAGATPGRLISESVPEFSKTRCDVPF